MSPYSSDSIRCVSTLCMALRRGRFLSVTVLPITSHLVEAPLLRVSIGPESGVERVSQIQIDKAHTPRRERLGPVIGRLDDATLTAVNWAVAVFLGLA